MREQLKLEHLMLDSLTDGMPSLVAAAHELKSPLSLIRQLSLMIEDESLSSGEKNRLVKQITLTSEKALRLTSDLTRFVRMNDAMFTLEPINSEQLCIDIVNELTPLYRANERTLRLSSRRRHLLLVANRDLLRRVLMNFSDNALRYSDDKTPVEISIGTLNQGSVVRLGVRDFGPAIASDVFGGLPGKLGSAPTAIHARPDSSGLGLFIANQFAHVMNGKLGVTRHRDGATFYIDLHASKQLALI